MALMSASLAQPNVLFFYPARWSLHRPFAATTAAFGSSPASAEERFWGRSIPRGCRGRRSTGVEGEWRVRHRGEFQVRAGVSDRESTVLKNLVDEVQSMRVSEIKRELTQLGDTLCLDIVTDREFAGVAFNDCFEKRDLVVRLASARLGNDKPGRRDSGHSTYKPLADLPLMRVENTVNSPKNYILVPLYINKKGPFNFILDTASSVTIIQPSIVVDTLRLPLRAAQQSVALLGGGVSNQNVMSVIFPTVSIGNHTMSHVDALVMDQRLIRGWDPSLAGLLGLNVLSQFDVEFDFKEKLLIFHPPGAASRGECNMKDMKQLETTEITMGILGLKAALGRAAPETAIFDLGSSLCAVTPDLAREAGVSNNVINSARPDLGGGGVGQAKPMPFSSGYIDTSLITKKNNYETRSSTEFAVKGAQFAIGEIPALRTVGCRLLLGVNLFESVRLIFSQSTKRVYIEWPTR